MRLDARYKCLYDDGVLKKVIWLGSTRRAVQAFPSDARRWGGYELYRVQEGMEPADWKAMPSVGPGVREIRIHTNLEHRILYVAKFAEAIYVLHAFEKKSQRTSGTDIALARKRFHALVRERDRIKVIRRE